MILPSVSEIWKIEISSDWVGFADPPSRSARLIILHVGDRFIREQADEGTQHELDERHLLRVINALARPPIPELVASLFESEVCIEWHYGAMWTDDYPSLQIQIMFTSGRKITILTHIQHQFMLPLSVTDSGNQASFETFDPELSRSLAELMPDGFLLRERLSGAGPIETEQEIGDFQKRLAAIKEDQNDNRLSKGLLRQNSIEELRELLDRCASPSIADETGTSVLMHAAFPRLDRERFRLLVEAGASVDARRDDKTGLHIACVEGDVEVVREWILAGANTEARNFCGSTPLMLSATWPDVVRMLLNERVDVNTTDDQGQSALVYAILGQLSAFSDGILDSIQAMIDAGANVNRKDCMGISPLGHAKKILVLLTEKKANQASNLNQSPVKEQISSQREFSTAVVKLLVAAGAME